MIDGNGVFVDGQRVDVDGFAEAKTVVINGDVGSLTTTQTVNVNGNVTGDVKADGSITIVEKVEGNVTCGGSCNCGEVGRDVNCGGSCHCGDVHGDVSCGGSFNGRRVARR